MQVTIELVNERYAVYDQKGTIIGYCITLEAARAIQRLMVLVKE